MHVTPHIRLARLLLAFLAILSPAPASGLVLCFEADGSLAVEMAMADGDCGACETASGTPIGGSDEGPVRSIGECPCVDVCLVGPAPTAKRIALVNPALTDDALQGLPVFLHGTPPIFAGERHCCECPPDAPWALRSRVRGAVLLL